MCGCMFWFVACCVLRLLCIVGVLWCVGLLCVSVRVFVLLCVG